MRSSAGNTRGLIEAPGRPSSARPPIRLPRGIPAASLKLDKRTKGKPLTSSLPRGIPAASLKLVGDLAAGRVPVRLPRGIPAASLKLEGLLERVGDSLRLPRGIPAASLKPSRSGLPKRRRRESSAGNTRGLIEASGRPGRGPQPERESSAVRIPVKSITRSDAKPIADSDANRSPVGAKRRGLGSRLRVFAPG